MVGGGQGAFIGAVHRLSSRLDGRFELTAGCFSSDPEKSKSSGQELQLDPVRVYSDYQSMAKTEAQRPDGIEAVSIVTPNHLHYPIAKAFLEHGITVICDKPITATLSEAQKLEALVEQSDARFFVTYNYTGYPLVRQAREMLAEGAIGDLRVVQVEYAQDWLTEESDGKQAEWRTDPARAGHGGVVGDIGTHALDLACFIAGQEVESLCADLHSFVDGRPVSDNAHVILHFQGGARGQLWCSQTAPGNDNGLKIRLYGSRGGLEWSQEEPDRLWYTPFGQPKRLITRNGAGFSDVAARACRLPAGHPEGYLEAFANLYNDIADAIGTNAEISNSPGITEGLRGVRFVDACLRSAAANSAWVTLG
jgi:predicted dehydrogenase